MTEIIEDSILSCDTWSRLRGLSLLMAWELLVIENRAAFAGHSHVIVAEISRILHVKRCVIVAGRIVLSWDRRINEERISMT